MIGWLYGHGPVTTVGPLSFVASQQRPSRRLSKVDTERHGWSLLVSGPVRVSAVLNSHIRPKAPNPIVTATVGTRERCGARAQDRFEFQASASIYKVLHHHELGADYRVLFDHVDDLLIYDDAENPTTVKVFQIKGWEGQKCSIAVVAAADNSEPLPRTIPGKLYWAVEKYGHINVDQFGIITNCVLNFKLKPKGRSTVDHLRVTGLQMDDDEWKRIEDAVSSDHPGLASPDYRSKWVSERVLLDVRGHQGQIRELLTKAMIDRGAVPDESPIYGDCTLLLKHVASKIGFAAEYEDGDVEALFRSKSITRREFEAFLKRPSHEPTFKAGWPTIERTLDRRKWDESRILKVQTACLAYIRDRVIGQLDAIEFSRAAKKVFENSRDSLSGCVAVLDAVDLLESVCLSGPLSEENPLADLYPSGEGR